MDVIAELAMEASTSTATTPEPSECEAEPTPTPESLRIFNGYLDTIRSTVANITPGDPGNALPGLLYYLDPTTPILYKLDRILLYLHNAAKAKEITDKVKVEDSIPLELLRLWILVLGPGKELTDTSVVPDEFDLQDIVDAIQLVGIEEEMVIRIRNSLINLAAHCLVKFFETNDMVFLDTTILVRSALLSRNPSVPSDPVDESLICALLTRRFKREATVETINEAIEHGRASIGDTPIEQVRSAYLGNLAVAFHERYKHYGMDDDINSALTLSKAAIDAGLREKESLQAIHRLRNNYITVVGDMAERAKASNEDVALSVKLVRDLLAETPLDDQDYHLRRFNMATLLSKMYAKVSDEAYIREATGIFEDMSTHEEDVPADLRLSIRVHLLNSYFFTYSVSKSMDGLEKAATLGKAILEQTEDVPANMSELAIVKTVLSQVHYYLFQFSGNHENLETAVKYFEEGNNNRSMLHPKMYFATMIFLARIYFTQDRYGEAMEKYRAILQVYPQYVMFGMNYRMDLATEWINLASESAAVFSRGGYFAEALEVLELGRSVAWTRGFQLRSQIDQLEGDHPEYAARFKDLSEALRKPEHDSKGPGVVGLVDMKAASWEKNFSLSAEWDTLLSGIRQLDGYQNFLRTPTYDDMKQLTKYGPIVVINVHRYRSDAFLLTIATLDRPQVVRLPLYFNEPVKTWSDSFLEGTKKMEAGEMTELEFGRIVLKPILKLLWEQIMQPIREALNALAPYARRVWLCPTGQLTFLPLHCVIDGLGYTTGKLNHYLPLIPSYTPTLASLLRARTEARAREDVPAGLFATSCESVEGFETIINAQVEVKALGHMRTPFYTTVLQGPNATTQNVLSEMAKHEWLHLACHGIPSTDEPYSSHFVLTDGPLFLSDIVSARLSSPAFAFLSACHSAAGMPSLSDESMHLAAGLHFAGYKAIVATMWCVHDTTAKRLAKALYKWLFRNPDAIPNVEDTAEALWRAVELLRSQGIPMSRLAPFIHSGV